MRVLLANQNGKYFERIIRIFNTILGDPGTANMVFFKLPITSSYANSSENASVWIGKDFIPHVQ